jgi:hypothetical protein
LKAFFTLVWLQTILFDDFQVWEGRCTPDKEPFSQKIFQTLPEWPGMKKITSSSNLKVDLDFKKASAGGASGKFFVENTATSACDVYQIHLHIRPSWGTIQGRDGSLLLHGAKIVEQDEKAGDQSK